MQLALIHSSANPKPGENNQRLEFLGDAILELIVSEYLYANHPNMNEGMLSIARSNFVCKANLAAVACRMGLGDRLILGKAELGQQGKHKPSILADAVEAQIGAIYLEYGMETAKKFVYHWVLGCSTPKVDIENCDHCWRVLARQQSCCPFHF